MKYPILKKNISDISNLHLKLDNTKIHQFKKKFFDSKALIYLGKNYSPKIKANQPLLNEIKYFFTLNLKRKPITDFSFSYRILKFLETI